MIGIYKELTIKTSRDKLPVPWWPGRAAEVKVIESRRDNDDNVNEISIVLPSDDDLWVALCALTPVPTTNRPFLNRQQTQTQHIRVRERAQLRHQTSRQ